MQHACVPSSTPCFEDSFEQWLPGLELTHILHISSAPDTDAISAVLSCIRVFQDAVDGWVVARRGATMVQRITLRRISEGSVRCLREQIAQSEKGLRIRLEHQCSRRS
jgi:hypothetical protein